MDLGSPAAGVVHSVFRYAVNLVVGQEFWTVLGADGGDLPFGVRVERVDLSSLGLRPGLEQRLDAVAAVAGGRCWPPSEQMARDVVVGVLAVLTSRGSETTRSVNDAIDRLVCGTTDVSAHLLRQAGAGLLSRALDDLLAALASASTTDEVRAAANAVIRIGATSGADTCMGVLAAAPTLLQHEKVAA